MSEFDPDNRVGAGGGSAFAQGQSGMRELRQGGNVTSRLPGRISSGESDGVGTTTVRQIRAKQAPEATQSDSDAWARTGGGLNSNGEFLRGTPTRTVTDRAGRQSTETVTDQGFILRDGKSTGRRV